MKKMKYQNPFDAIIEELKELEELIKKEEPGKQKVFARHHVMTLHDVTNLKTIWDRFSKTREDLFKLDYLDRILSDARQKKKLTERGERKLKTVWKKHATLTRYLRVDFISLFLFLDIYLNKVPLLGRVIWGTDINGVEYKSFTAFLGSLRKDKHKNIHLKGLYNALSPDMQWIESKLGFYRDKFITHQGSPYQEWFGWGYNTSEVSIEHINYDLGSDKQQERVRNVVAKVKKIFPEIQEMEDIRQKVYFLAKNLYRIDHGETRGEVADLIRSIGTISPNIYSIISIVIKFSRDYYRYLRHLITKGVVPYGLIMTEYSEYP